MEEKYEKTYNGDYKIDIHKIGLITKILIIISAICTVAIPLLLIEQLWLDYLPTTKLLITNLVIGFPCFKLAQASLYDFEDNGLFTDKYVLREEYRLLIKDEKKA